MKHQTHSAHDHHAHGHIHGRGNERAIGIAALLTGAFMMAEVVGGIVSGSLALLADAGPARYNALVRCPPAT